MVGSCWARTLLRRPRPFDTTKRLLGRHLKAVVCRALGSGGSVVRVESACGSSRITMYFESKQRVLRVESQCGSIRNTQRAMPRYCAWTVLSTCPRSLHGGPKMPVRTAAGQWQQGLRRRPKGLRQIIKGTKIQLIMQNKCGSVRWRDIIVVPLHAERGLIAER